MSAIELAGLRPGACGPLGRGSMLLTGMTTPEPGAMALAAAMSRFASGDDAALGEVYDRASPAVFTFLMRLCRDSALAEDLTQETFLRLHRARGLYRPGAPVMPWAYTIARRLFLDAVRSRRHEAATSGRPRNGKDGQNGPDGHEGKDGNHGRTGGGRTWSVPSEIAAAGPSAEDLLADVELAGAVNEALARLPEAQASAFRLLKGEGLSVAEAAAVMGTTKGAVKLRAHRAYEALRGMLNHHFSGTAPGNSPTKRSTNASRQRPMTPHREKSADGRGGSRGET